MSSDHIWPILFFVSLAGNLILLFYRPLLRLLRRGEEVSEDEIMAMVEEGEESGAIERNEKELIENVFEFNNTTAEDVMIHRTDMVTLSLDDDEETILSAIRESGLSRFPVYQGNVDDIVGILSTRQYLLNFHVERPQELRALLRPAYFVPETVRADVLFRDMQSKKIHMAVVVDEYGGTSGLVTLEDLLEELVGNIYDEFDPQAEQEIIQLEENLWRVSGSADLEELAHTSVMVVCAGAKAILDLPLTLEYLETKGVPVLGYQTKELPAFYTRTSGLAVDYQVNSPEELAKVLKTHHTLGLKGGILVANPIPQAYSMDADAINAVIDQAVAEADEKGIHGKQTTPFLLAKVKEITGGDSLEANIQLVFNNAKLAAQTAVAYSALS